MYASATATGVTDARLAGLRRWNLALALLHGLQAVVVLALAFSSFAVNQWLQYREIGPWRDYGFGEKSYLVLSLVAKSLLAWQIFGGSLAT